MKRPLLPALLATATLALPAHALDIDAMSTSERDAFRAEVRAYLLENPEVIMEAVAVLEQRDAESQAAADIDLVRTNAAQIFGDTHSWEGGNPDGDITMVEFVDYRCGYCRRAAPEVEDLVNFDGNIRLVIKEYPILGPQSVLSSRFAIATKQIAGDDAYKAAHDALITFKGEINDISLRRLGDSLDLDSDAILAHMDSADVSAVIISNEALGARLQLTGTPSFVMDERLLRGYLPLEAMQQLADEIRTQ